MKTVGSYSRIGANGGTGILTVKTGGSYDNTGASNGNLTIGQDSGSSGTLNVEGGEFTVKGFIALNYNAGAKTSVVNVTDGGVLACNKMYLHNPGQGGTVNIDGGTLKAYGADFNTFLPADNGLNVYAGVNGATFDSAVAAASVTFRADATVGGSATLAVPMVAVSNGVSATVNAPTAGVFEKTGPGTLTLGASRTGKTDIAEGTLVVSGAGTTIPWDDVMLGTESGKTAVLKFENGATLASVSWNMALGHDVDGPVGGGVTVELHKDGGDWNVPNKLTVGWNDGDVGKFYFPAKLHINGGTFKSVGTFIAGNNANAVGVIDLNAVGDSHGVLETKGLTLGSGSATLTFNGGELKAAGNLESSGLIKSGIAVSVPLAENTSSPLVARLRAWRHSSRRTIVLNG